MNNVSIFLAFGAGLLSFLSPCVLPLIPSYLCVLGGSPADADNKHRPVARTAGFVAGFSVVFIVLSIIFSITFNLMGGIFRYINIISGLVVIILGINIIFNFLSFLNYEKRLHLKNKPRGIIGAFLAGGAFGAGWTPCVGSALGSILLLAAQGGGVPRAALYLACYSLGLGLPFLFAAVFFNIFLKISAGLRGYMPVIQRVSGALLVVIGVLIISGKYQALSVMAAQWQARLQNKNSSEAAYGESPAYEVNEIKTDTDDKKIPDNVIRAFKAANIPVTDTGIDPIDFTLPLLDGTNITLSGLKGKVVFLNFWATWCGPCRSEMPSMEKVHQTLKDRDFIMLAVNLRDSKKEVESFMLEYNLSYPAVLDLKGVTGNYYNVQAIPTTYIIDKRGLIVGRLVGSINWNTPHVIAAMETLLE